MPRLVLFTEYAYMHGHQWLKVAHGYKCTQVRLMADVPLNSNMLLARNAVGKLPEDVAATHAIWLLLRKRRLDLQEQGALIGEIPLSCF